MSLPALELAINTGKPVVVCARPWARNLLRSYQIDDFISIDSKLYSSAKLVKQHKVANYKHGAFGLLLPDSLSSALIFKYAGIKSSGYRDDGRTLFLNTPINKPTIHMHAVEAWHNLVYTSLLRWGLQPSSNKPGSELNLKLDDQHHEAALNALNKAGIKPGEFVLIAPTAVGTHKGRNKVWPHFNNLTSSLIAQGIKVAMCPPPSETEQAISNAPDATIIPSIGVGEFAALTLQSKLVVCNDSGVSHLAAAAGAQQITLFGVTDSDRTGPWSKKAIYMGSNNHWPDPNSVIEQVQGLI